MGKLIALFNAMRKGAEVTNAELWKRGLITGSMVAGLLSALVALLRAFGVEVPVTSEQLADIAVGIVAVGGVVVGLLTAATSDRAGLPGLKSAQEHDAGKRVAEATAAASAASAEGKDAAGSNSSVVHGSDRDRDAGVDKLRVEPTDPFRDHGA